MTIRVLFFAQLREAAGGSSIFMQMPEGASVRDLVRRLSADRAELKLDELPLVFAVNESFEPAETALRNDDTVALMIPVSGG